MTKTVYRVGDRVKIINPILVERVGYPLTPNDLLSEFMEHPNLHKAMELFNLHLDIPGCRLRLVHALTYIACANRGFGGRERKLHTSETPYLKDKIVKIEGKRIVKTGLYFPPSSWQSHEGEWDGHSGGLENEQTHIILDTDYGSFQSIHVELIKDACAKAK
jgi:hypothetical protein